MNPCDKIIKILRYKKQEDLANLLLNSFYDFTESTSWGSQYNSILTTLNIYSPIKQHEKLSKLVEGDKKKIISAFHIFYPVKAESIEITWVEFFVDYNNPIPETEITSPKREKLETNYWKNGCFRMFISHSSKIKIKANELSKALENYAISCFVAHDDIEPTKEWQDVIEDALFTCDGMVAFLNKDFQSSLWTDQEVGICYGINKIIIPVRMGINPYGFLGKYQGVPGKGKSIKLIAHDIFKLLNNREDTQEKISTSITNLFIKSSSYLTTFQTIILLETLKYIDADQLKGIKKSVETNSQIKGAFGIPKRIGSFIKTWEEKLKD